VATLTDYLDRATLQQLQDIFTLGTRAQLRIFDAGGQCVTEVTELPAEPAGPAKTKTIETPIVLAGQTLGQLVLEVPGRGPWPTEQLGALAAALEIPPARLRSVLQGSPQGGTGTRNWRGLLSLTSEFLGRLCRQAQQLNDRVEELATLYTLTALFTGQTDMQQVLDTVVKTVVAVTKVKAAGLRLLDRQTNELTIEAVANLSKEYLSKGKILLADSILDTEAFRTGEVVYIADSRTDPRVMYPQEAAQEGIVSAIIAPLIYKDQKIGLLRLYTAEPKEFSHFEVALVKAIAAEAAAAIANAQLHAESLQAQATSRQLRLAAEVQRRMIPASPPKVAGLDLATVYLPSLELSGDFYDFIELPNDNLGLAICDVMGKGTPTGLLMASVRASLRAHAGDLYSLSEILSRVNRSLCNDSPTTAFATLFYGVINLPSMQLTYANGGHEPPLLIRRNQVRPLVSGGMALGVDRHSRYEHALAGLQGGDVLILATDGLVEAMNFQDEQFGRERVVAGALDAIGRGENADGIAKHILWQMRRFAGLRDRDDDVTMVVLRVV